jgi:hypothetical protein
MRRPSSGKQGPAFENLAAEPGGGPRSQPCRLVAVERTIGQAGKDLLAVETHRTSPVMRVIARAGSRPEDRFLTGATTVGCGRGRPEAGLVQRAHGGQHGGNRRAGEADRADGGEPGQDAGEAEDTAGVAAAVDDLFLSWGFLSARGG